MSRLSSNSVFLILLATFFVLLFLNHYLNAGYKKDGFSSFKQNSVSYPNTAGLTALDSANSIYYDTANGNIIDMKSATAVKVLTSSSTNYNTYDLTNQTDVTALNNLPQTIPSSGKAYGYEIVRDLKYLVYIPVPFVNLIEINAANNFIPSKISVKPTSDILKSVLDAPVYNDLILISQQDQIYQTMSGYMIHIIGDNIRIISLASDEKKLFNKTDTASIKAFLSKYSLQDSVKKAEQGVNILYEINPNARYLFYLTHGANVTFLTIIDVSTSTNALTAVSQPTVTNQPAAATNQPVITVPTNPKYPKLDGITSRNAFAQTGIPQLCPTLSTAILNWYDGIQKANPGFSPYGNIDGSGKLGDEKRFGNQGPAGMDLMPILIKSSYKPTDIGNYSDLGTYEDEMKRNSDTDGSKTASHVTPGKTILQTLNDFAISKSWKLGTPTPVTPTPVTPTPVTPTPVTPTPVTPTPVTPTPVTPTPVTEKYLALDRMGLMQSFSKSGIPVICPNFSAVLLKWYEGVRNKNNNFTPLGAIDGDGTAGDAKRFGNPGAATGILALLISNVNKPSDVGLYEDALAANNDTDGSKTANIINPSNTLLQSLNKYGSDQGWKIN